MAFNIVAVHQNLNFVLTTPVEFISNHLQIEIQKKHGLELAAPWILPTTPKLTPAPLQRRNLCLQGGFYRGEQSLTAYE